MNRAAGLLALLMATAAAWSQTPDLPTPARLWTVTLLVPLPALMVLQARQLRHVSELPRRAVYISSMVSLWLLAAITLGVVSASGQSVADIGIGRGNASEVILWATGLTAAGIAILFGFRLLGAREAPVLQQLLPQNSVERSLYTLLSLSAGVCEEIAFRGFLLHALYTTTSVPVAVLVSSGAFGVLHAYQHPAGALRASVLGALLALPVALGQPLLASILAHTAIDVISGLWLARYLLR